MAKKTVNQEMQIITRKISDLIRAEYNPRELTKEQENQLTDSLKRFGLVDPIIVNTHKDRKNILVGGHQRMKVWESMGNETIPTVEVNLNLEKEKELNIRLNKNTGQFDMELIQEHFETDDLIEWGFNAEELEFFVPEVLEAEEDDFSVPDGGIQTDIVLGDLFEIGEHRLLCGDSTDSDQVAKLMNGVKADMVFTDPPYGMNLDTNYADIYKNSIANVKNQDKIIGDDKEFNFLDFYALFEYVKEQFWWGADYYQNQLPSNGGIFVWDKVCESMEGRIGNEFELCWSKQRHKKEIIHIKWAGFLGLQKEDGKRQHPTQKPIRLCESFISRFSKESNLLIDPFLGSGSTMVAAHQLKRKCYGMELDPKYCQVIVDRMMKLDESLTVKINGKQYKK